MGEGYFQKHRYRGMALAASLMLSVLILVLGMSLLTTSQHDLAFQRQQRARDSAELLARSGLEHCLFLLTQLPPPLNTPISLFDTPQRYDVLAPTEYFTIERRSEFVGGPRVLLVEGVVTKTNGEVMARRTIVVPYGPNDNQTLTRQEIETQAFYK